MFPESLNKFITLSKQADVIPVYEECPASFETPISVFMKLNSSEYAFFAESVEPGIHKGRYSLICCFPTKVFWAEREQVYIEDDNGFRTFKTQDPLEDLKKMIKQIKQLKVPEIPLFTGGAVGYMGFDMIRYWENIPKKQYKGPGFPNCCFMFFDEIIIFDHVKQKMFIVVNAHVKSNPEQTYTGAVKRIQQLKNLLKHTCPNQKLILENQNFQQSFRFSQGKKQFENIVKKAKDHIIQGDIFQVVLSDRIQFELKIHPLAVYNSLRALNPSPYMFYLNFQGIHMVGSSPETMVKVQDGAAELRPIAGTRPRGKSEAEDIKFKEELLEDEKERAEHLMLVDLARNDLGRICEFGSVEVKEFLKVENYSHVMHLVSKVTGRLRSGIDCFDVIRATFPAGTVSGAPKIKAVEIIDELERNERGPYAGCVGFIDYQGNMDTCITIRTLITQGHDAYIQAGAGIVADSKPEKEFEEVKNKAQALLTAIGPSGKE